MVAAALRPPRAGGKKPLVRTRASTRSGCATAMFSAPTAPDEWPTTTDPMGGSVAPISIGHPSARPAAAHSAVEPPKSDRTTRTPGRMGASVERRPRPGAAGVRANVPSGCWSVGARRARVERVPIHPSADDVLTRFCNLP